MRLESLVLENWKSFGAQGNTLPLAPLTLLVGPNASGKSNALDALRFLQGAALDYPLGDVLRGRYEGQREVWPAIRGGVAEATRVGTTSFRVKSCWSPAGEAAVLHEVSVSTAAEVAIDAERLAGSSLHGDHGYLFDTHAPARRTAAGRTPGGGISAALRAKGKGNSPTVEYSSLRSLLGQVEPGERVHPSVVELAHKVRGALREAVFLDIRPSMMRDYRPENGGHLGSSGENVSPVLLGLDARRRADVVDWLSELCAPEIEDIEFDVTRLREVMMILVEKGGRRTSARSASDGTLRFLGELVALLTCPEGTLLVLEEPDVGLHPSRIRLLAELLEDITARRGIQVIATTHSPGLLAHLSARALGDVVAFGREPSTGDTVCRRVSDLPHFATLRDARDLEHLVSTGWLERAL
jgi:predicted ATPase